MMISEVATEGRIYGYSNFVPLGWTLPFLDLSYTYVNKGSPRSLVFFEMSIFKMRRAGPGAHVLKGPAPRIVKMFISLADMYI